MEGKYQIRSMHLFENYEYISDYIKSLIANQKRSLPF